jgi:hypothetical protein
MASTYLNGTVLRTYDGPAESGDPNAISVDFFYRQSYLGQTKKSSMRSPVAIQGTYVSKLAALAILNP